MKDTVLIYSGGLDSTSALYKYKKSIGIAISFYYGSKHNDREIEMAEANCRILNIPHKVVDLSAVFKGISSALLGQGDIPHGHYENESMKATVVAFRNGVMLSIATSFAEDRGCTSVMIGSHKGDNAVYPDCTPEFNKGISAAMQAGTYNKVTLFAPFEALDKREVAKIGIEHGMLPELTYSCYEGEFGHCNKCSTCIERLWALGEMTDEEVEATRDV